VNGGFQRRAGNDDNHKWQANTSALHAREQFQGVHRRIKIQSRYKRYQLDDLSVSAVTATLTTLCETVATLRKQKEFDHE
jgi:hypothetical protein